MTILNFLAIRFNSDGLAGSAGAQVARTPVDSKLLPQIHVNLGVALEYDGYLMGACEHYREAAILNTHHHRSLKHLGSALFGAPITPALAAFMLVSMHSHTPCTTSQACRCAARPRNRPLL